jgi:hypothetical protein
LRAVWALRLFVDQTNDQIYVLVWCRTRSDGVRRATQIVRVMMPVGFAKGHHVTPINRVAEDLGEERRLAARRRQ